MKTSKTAIPDYSHTEPQTKTNANDVGPLGDDHNPAANTLIISVSSSVVRYRSYSKGSAITYYSYINDG